MSQVTFPGLSGGFLPATSLADTVTPFSRGYTWSSGATLSDPTVVVTARDGVGNTSTASYGITPDSLAPSTTDSSASLGNGWHNTSQTVVPTPTDAGSGVAATNWTIDGSTPTGSSSQGTSVALSSDGVYTVRYRSTDNVGNAEAVRVAGSQIRIDRTSPSTATLATLPAAIRNGQALSAAAADALSGVSFMTYLYCAGAACTPATVIASSTAGPSYPVSWSDMPADGTYQVLVRATDVAGNIRDSAKQTVTIDNTPPVTAISSGPASPTSVTTATFTFSSQSGSTFQCQLDGAAYAACTSPRSYTALADGTHTFHVRATDPAGNTEVAPPSWTWTIDTVVPDTTLASAPPTQSASDTATFTFSSPDSTATFECRLDAGAYAACASPWTLSGLSDGPHTAVIRSVDAAGNRDGSPVTHGWTIDTTAPETSITASPVTPSPSGDASFSFTSPDSAATFQCRLDAGSWTSCASPTSYTGLPEGSHSFEVRGVDPLANTDPTPSTQTWIIDTTAPDTTITTGPTDPSDTADAAFTFTSPESPATFECRLDGGTWLTCTSPWSLTALPSGSHTAEVRAVDPAGNPDETPASHTWTVAPPLP